jgi:hypothetical protein
MKTDTQRTCPSCGNEFSGAMEFCPVCMLRKGRAVGVESGESSVSEETAKPIIPGQAAQRFDHHELATGEDGKAGRVGSRVRWESLQCIRRDLRFEAINEAEAVIEIRRNGLGVRTAPASRRARLIHWASLLRSDDSLEFSTVKGRLSILHFGIMRISPRCNIKPICFP